MKAIVVAALIAGFSTLPGVAAPIDLSAQTCKQFQESSPDEIKIILAWLDGYYKDEKDPPVIDTDKFVSNAKKLGEYCSANPTIGLITATDNCSATASNAWKPVHRWATAEALLERSAGRTQLSAGTFPVTAAARTNNAA
jgi:acid stress chaperone HdeB